MNDRIVRENIFADPKLIAHRGLTNEAPENSNPAFRKAGENGFWAIETDVHKTKDGILVCNHNQTVDEQYDGSVTIAEMSFSELKRYHFKGAWTKKYSPEELSIPTFSDYLDACKKYGALPFIEIKIDDIKAVIEAALAIFSEDEIIISSTDLKRLIDVRKYSERVFVHHIFSSQEAMELLCDQGPCGVSYNYPRLSSFPKDLLERTHSRGAKLCLRAGDTLEQAAEMIEIGLDYIPTNCITPAQLKQYK